MLLELPTNKLNNHIILLVKKARDILTTRTFLKNRKVKAIVVVGNMIQQNPRWLYFHERCVGRRSGNDSFLDQGYFKRFKIDVVGYGEILTALCRKSSLVRREVVSKLIRGHIRTHVRYMKFFNTEKKTSNRFSGFAFYNNITKFRESMKMKMI